MGRSTNRFSWAALGAGLALLTLTAATWPTGPARAAARQGTPAPAPAASSTPTTFADPPDADPLGSTTSTSAGSSVTATPTTATTATTSAATNAPPTPAPPAPAPPAPAPAATVAPTGGGGVATAVRYALAQLGKPYRAAAAGPAAFDCSGLTLAAYARAGVRLPHYAAAQARLGRAVDWQRGGVRPGDLVFTAGGRPRHDLGHVGIAVSATEWVSAPAPGKVVHRSAIPFRSVQAVRRLVAAGS